MKWALFSLVAFAALSMVSATIGYREITLDNGTIAIEEYNYDSSCYTTWICNDGIAVKADWINPVIAKYGDRALKMGYKNINGKYCFADPKEKPSCQKENAIASPSPIASQSPIESITESPTPLVISILPKKKSFFEWLFGWLK